MQKIECSGWMDGWMDGWVEVKAGLRIAYSNQKPNHQSGEKENVTKAARKV